MSELHPRILIEDAVRYRRDHGIPIAKYRLVVEVSANTHQEIETELRILAMNWLAEYDGRHTIDATTGTTTVVLETTNASQTPDQYSDELDAWSSARRSAR